MKTSEVHETIDRMGDLPSLPQTLLAIQQVAGDSNSSAKDLAACILRDQALTLRVLRVVNSAAYRRTGQEEVHSVDRAVVALGFQQVKQLALGLSVFEMMSKLSRSPLLLDLAKHSLVTAGFAQTLARASGAVNPDTAFVMGLIHDIGKLVLIECDPVAMDQVARDLEQGIHLHEAERRHFGLSHDRAGRRLAARWGLPREFQDIIGEHHDHDPRDPSRGLDPLLAVIVFANAMADFTGEVEQLPVEHAILRKASRVLGIPAQRLDRLHQEVIEGTAGLARTMGFEISDLADFGELVNAEGSATVAPREMTADQVARRTAQQLELYQDIGQGMAEGVDPYELVGRIMQGAVQILGFDRVIYFQATRKAKLLRPRAWSGAGVADIIPQLDLPLTRKTGALALALLEHRSIHVPRATSRMYGDLSGETLLSVTQCTGYAVAPVMSATGVVGVIYGDCGVKGPEVAAEQAHELEGLATQLGMILTVPSGAHSA